MEISQITAISPVDGRYRGASEPLDNYYSEFALIRFRIFIRYYLYEIASLRSQ